MTAMWTSLLIAPVCLSLLGLSSGKDPRGLETMKSENTDPIYELGLNKMSFMKIKLLVLASILRLRFICYQRLNIVIVRDGIIMLATS